MPNGHAPFLFVECHSRSPWPHRTALEGERRDAGRKPRRTGGVQAKLQCGAKRHVPAPERALLLSNKGLEPREQIGVGHAGGLGEPGGGSRRRPRCAHAERIEAGGATGGEGGGGVV